jgi:Protein of unknown function (DUF2804)
MGQSEPMRIPKRWRYVGVYGPEVMLCAGIVRVGGVPQCFWAVWDRERRVLRERTRRRLGTVALPEGAVRVRDGGVAIDLTLAPAGEAIAVQSLHGGGRISTRKAPATARGTVVLDGRAIAVDAPALVDDSDGYHARETAWDSCAGAGRAADGRAVAWNLVAGVHDAPSGSERRVWIDRAPREVRPSPSRPRSARSATWASRPRRSVPATTACSSASSRASTASPSERSRARCPAASRSPRATA